LDKHKGRKAPLKGNDFLTSIWRGFLYSPGASTLQGSRWRLDGGSSRFNLAARRTAMTTSDRDPGESSVFGRNTSTVRFGVKETIGKNHCNINALVISKTHQGNNWGNIERILQRADVPAVPRGSQSSLNQK
jgi:hypothetical protein